MPLSEQEQQILDEIEKSLYQEDPRFARQVRRSAPRSQEIRKVKVGAGIFLLGSSSCSRSLRREASNCSAS